jgi:hypothetical protein
MNFGSADIELEHIDRQVAIADWRSIEWHGRYLWRGNSRSLSDRQAAAVIEVNLRFGCDCGNLTTNNVGNGKRLRNPLSQSPKPKCAVAQTRAKPVEAEDPHPASDDLKRPHSSGRFCFER